MIVLLWCCKERTPRSSNIVSMQGTKEGQGTTTRKQQLVGVEAFVPAVCARWIRQGGNIPWSEDMEQRSLPVQSPFPEK